jgi:hypothetical protein
MKFHASLIATLGLIGGACLITALPANAALPATASPGSSTTAPMRSSSMPSGSAMYQGNRESPHQVAVLQEALDSTGAHLKIDGPGVRKPRRRCGPTSAPMTFGSPGSSMRRRARILIRSASPALTPSARRPAFPA